MMKKADLSAEQIYKKNKRLGKIFKTLAPITWIILLAVTILFLSLALRNSVGNVLDILDLLDKDKYNRSELQENYALLAERWGEWEIAGAENGAFAIKYIDISNAMFSGLMLTYTTLTGVSFCLAVVFGKIVFPKLAKLYESSNEELVDLATLKSATQIDAIVDGRKNRKEWF